MRKLRKTTGDTETDMILEAHVEVIDFLYDRAACGNWELPITSQDWFAWICDEAQLQEDMIEQYPHEEEQRKPFLEELKKIMSNLQSRNVEPSALPWEKET